MKVIYIDPMSYNNLAIYDSCLLSNVNANIYFVGNELYDSKQIKSIEFYPFFNYSKKKGLNKVISYISSLIKIIGLVKSKNPNIIHIQWIRFWYADYILLRYLIKKKIKVVYTAHNILPHRRQRFDFIKYKKYYKLVDSIIVHTENSKEILISNFKIEEYKINVIPHGILDLSTSINRDKVEILKNEIRHRYNLNKKIVFSSLGAQDLYKGTDFIFNVWNEAFSSNNNVFLFACGKLSDEIAEVAESTKISNFNNTYTKFNRIENELFLAILQLSDVVLLPYRKISQSGVLLSAINEQIPFIVSNAGGLSDALSIGNVGWNIGYANRESLLTTLKYIINNSEEIKNKKENITAWSKIHKYYSWEVIGQKTTDLYNRILYNCDKLVKKDI